MELRHLRAFLAVAEELHFTRAAARLGLSPPSLSAQIRLLETQLGVLLFHRTQRRVALSRAGELLVPEARAMLDSEARLQRLADRAARGEAGRIHIGYVGSAAFSGVLQAEVARFRAGFPDVELQWSEVAMPDMPEMVGQGALDIAFLRWPSPLGPGLGSRVLLRDRFCLALPAAHPLARGEGAVPPQALAGLDFVMPEQQAGTAEVGRRGGFTPRIVATPGHLAAVATLVSLGVGVAVVPQSLARLAMPGVRFMALQGTDIPSAIAAIFRRGETSKPVRGMIRSLGRDGEAAEPRIPPQRGRAPTAA